MSKFLAITALGLTVFFSSADSSPGGWGSGGCFGGGFSVPVLRNASPGMGLVSPLVTLTPSPLVNTGGVLNWRPAENDSNLTYGYRVSDGKIVAGYRYNEECYRDRDPETNTWGPPQHRDCWGNPLPGPCKSSSSTSMDKLPPATTGDESSVVVENFGVYRDQEKENPCYSINGHKCSREDVLRVLEKNELKDDSNLGYITVIAKDEAVRVQVLKDLDEAPSLASFKGKFRIWACEPSHFSVAKTGFKAEGNPTIYCQDATGKVLHRQDDYKGAEDLAAALRKADPNYDPNKDPDTRKPPKPAPTPDNTPITLPELPPVAWLLIGIAAVFLFLHFQKQKQQAAAN